MKPALLRPDNFTPPTRTPWGGRKILAGYKGGLGLDPRFPIVGESWEVSVDPSFQSRLAETDETLSEVIARDPVGWLGARVAGRYGGQTPLLVKLLDSADNLSVQVHPRDGDPELLPGESGKPESWIILEAEEGAGLYLGFKEGVNPADVAACIKRQGELDRLLNFVPVRPGDVFVIDAGTAHAIGRGVTLVEPQFVAPGRSGVTYRYWDWNRRYDDQGRLDPKGIPRALNLDRSLQVTDWAGARGDGFVEHCRPDPVTLVAGPVSRRQLVHWEWFHVEEWAGTGCLEISAVGTLWALTCVRGETTVSTRSGDLMLKCGQSGVVPATTGALRVSASDMRIFATRSV